MKCSLCDGTIIRKTDIFMFQSKCLGDVPVPSVEFEECQACHEKSLGPEMSRYLIEYVKTLERDAILNLPVKEFISLNEAASILGVTKQAFSKNPKIKRGFIYFTLLDGRRLFSKRSVELFAKSGDGRFPIASKTNSTMEYITKFSQRIAEEKPYTQSAKYEAKSQWHTNRTL